MALSFTAHRSGRIVPIAGSFALALSIVTANAGPVADFEKSLAAAYAPYREALMQTNQKDKAASEQALQAFELRWAGLMKTYKTTPPPQYADDAKWSATIAAVDRTIAAAKVETAKGELVKAHHVLEDVRKQLGDLRSRNGVITFSDRMDAYHEKIEQIIGAKYGNFDAEGRGALCEDASVLAYLAKEIERNPSEAIASDPAFKQAFAALKASIDVLQTAARSGDKAAIDKAIDALKPPYARMFVKYG